MAVIGIDLGTTNSLVSVFKDGRAVLIPNSFGEVLTPSVVSIDDDGSILIGKIAKERLVSHPSRTAASFKQNMGAAVEYKLGDQTFYPEDLSSFVIRQLKEDAERFLNEEVTEAVISVPAYFNNDQRFATKTAGKLAGVTVERIINEPSAAAICYKHMLDKDGTYLVFDLGGGTLDISIVDIFDNVVDILAVAGDNHFGGNNFDKAIRDHFIKQNPELAKGATEEARSYLLEQAEKCKQALSELKAAVVLYRFKDKDYQLSLSEDDLLKISAPLFGTMKNAMKKALRDSSMNIEQIDEVLLIGGSTKMPLVKQYVEYLTKKTPKCDINPDCAVGIGAGLVSGIKQRQDEIRDTVLVDICPFSLGIGAAAGELHQVEFSPIIERNSSLPISRSRQYQTVQDNQKSVEFKVYQGESLDINENLFLCEIKVSAPPLPKGEAMFNVRFTYDINGILEIDVICTNNGNRSHKLFIQNSNLTQSEIDSRLKELEKLKISPQETNDTKLLIAQAQRLYEENYGPQRELISYTLNQFLFEVEHDKNITSLLKSKEQFAHFLDTLEDDNFGLND